MTDELTEAEALGGLTDDERAAVFSGWDMTNAESQVVAQVMTVAIERILADRLAVARAEALTEAANDFRTEGRDVMFNKAGDDLSPQGRVTKWLRDRAAAVARDGEGL